MTFQKFADQITENGIARLEAAKPENIKKNHRELWDRYCEHVIDYWTGNDGINSEDCAIEIAGELDLPQTSKTLSAIEIALCEDADNMMSPEDRATKYNLDCEDYEVDRYLEKFI